MRTVRSRFAACVLCALASVCTAAPPSTILRDEARLLRRTLPDAELRLADGRVTRLSTLWQDRPLLLTLFYRHCTGTCFPSLLLLRDAAARVGGLGRDYRVLGLSFAESDTAEDMRAQAAALGLEHDPNWLFAVGSRQDVQHIADALGFWFRFDSASGQYDHPTLLVAVERGEVVRALYGYPISGERFRELVWELRGRFVPYYQIPGQSALRCFEFDPRSGGLRPDWGMLLLLAPGLSALAAAAGMFALQSSSRNRMRESLDQQRLPRLDI
jgi:cytochrome oxidase Cu insertion factor (SCO1/SenC/PrrC family)